MKIHRFFTKQPLSVGQTTSFPEFYTQTNRVLKLRVGENIVLFNGDGNEYVSNIVSYGKGEVDIKIEKADKNDVSPSKNIVLLFSLIKKDNVEWIIQKGTELGVSQFVPIISERSEKKDINMERVEKILIEATEQSGRGFVPKLEEVVKLKDVLERFDIPLIVLEKGSEPLSKDEFKNEQMVGLLIGPEGGWSPNEIDMFKNKKTTFRSLGTSVLRAETAAIASASVLLL